MRTKFLLTALFLGVAFGNSIKAESDDPVIMKINGNEILKSEFEYIYNKNSQQQTSEQKSLEEYVDLFVNFKLKVFAAEKQGLDTVQTFVNELEGYRKQLAKPYLTDSKIEDRLAFEAYERLKENVEVSHILLRVQPNATPEQEKEVYNKLIDYKRQIEAGANFNELAFEVSEDPSAKSNKGALGYISGFMTVYPFECAAYNTPVGKMSEPVKTSFGYHLVYVTNRRKDNGEVLTQHIMKMLDRNCSDEEMKNAEKEMNEIYAKLQKGERFDELAVKYSDDKGSARDGGKLPWFGAGRMVPDFEKQAFALKNTNDYSKPFKSPYGWHIVKLIDRRDLADFEDKKDEIYKRIKRDERAAKGQDLFISGLKSQYNVSCTTDNAEKLESAFKECGRFDSLYFEKTKGYDFELVKIAGNSYTTCDFNDFVKTNKALKSTANNNPFDEKVKEYVDYQVLKYEESQLDKKYPDYRNLMREYRDGILLFEISNKEVWNKASADETGLAKFFKKNKKKYTWEKPHFKGLLIECKTAEAFDKAKMITEGIDNDSIIKILPAEMNNDSVRVVRIKKGLFAPGDNKVVDALELNKENQYKDKTYPEAFLKGVVMAQPESYEDVKGLVTSDYQNHLDKEWIKKLRKKSKIEINKDVLKTVKSL